MGHTTKQKLKQPLLEKSFNHNCSHGGELRKRRRGRGRRPLSCREPLHLVFKINKQRLKSKSLRSPKNFILVQKIVRRYAGMFYVKVEQISVQYDHIHLLVRTSQRSFYHYFFRVVAGQIAQQLDRQGSLVTDTPDSSDAHQDRGGPPTPRLWKLRPFTRVVKGWKAYQTVRNYIQLNEQEAKGIIKYNRQRLSGLSMGDWALLWS